MSLTAFIVAVGGVEEGAVRDCAHESVEHFLSGLTEQPTYRYDMPGATVWQSSVHADDSKASVVREIDGLHSRIVVFDGWIENREQAITEIAGKMPSNASDASIALAGYRKWGHDVAARLYGEYSFVVLDFEVGKRSPLAVAVRDKVGVRPLFFAQWPGGIGFANFPAALVALPWLSAAPNEGFMAEFLCGEVNSVEETFYCDVRRLLGGHHFLWQREVAPRNERYWLPHSDVDSMTSATGAGRLRQLIEDIVANTTRGVGLVGIKQSGGVDSSAVAMVLANRVARGVLPADDVLALSMVFPGLACDESAYLDDIAQVVPFAIERAPARYATATQLDDWTRRTRYPAYPFISTGGWPLFDLLRARGGRVMLDGEGGDELLRPAPSALLRAAVDVRQSRALIGFFRQRWRGRRRDFSVRGTLRFWIDPAIAQPLNNWWSRHFGRVRHCWESPIDAAWAARVALHDRLDRLSAHHWTARTVGTSLSLSGEWSVAYESIYFQSVCQKVELRHPLLSAQLIEFCNRLPLALLDGQEARTRLLLRAGVADRLPASVAMRRDKAEFTASVLPALREVCADLLVAADGGVSLDGLGTVSVSVLQKQGVWGLAALRAVATWWRLHSASRGSMGCDTP